MASYSIPKELQPYLHGVFLIFFYFATRKVAYDKDFFYLDIPKWLRRIFYIVDVRVEKVSLSSVIFQSVTVISLIIYILGHLGFNVLSVLELVIPLFSLFHGDFNAQFSFWCGFYIFGVMVPLSIYGAVCDLVIK